MTQAAFAREVGLSGQNAVTRLERGDLKGLPAEIILPLLLWARGRGTSADSLLFGRDPVLEASLDQLVYALARKAPDDILRLWPKAQDFVEKVEKDTRRPERTSWEVTLLEPGFKVVDVDQLPPRWSGRYVPIIGRIAAGKGIDTTEAESHPAGLADAYLDFADAPPGAFALRIQGDSMVPYFNDGDVVIVDGARPVRSGICAAVIRQPDGERIARIKRLTLRGRIAVLESANPSYRATSVPADQVDAFAIWRHLPLVRRQTRSPE